MQDLKQNYEAEQSKPLVPTQPKRALFAALCAFISACFFVLCFMNTKFILELYPSLSPISILFLRSVFSSLIMIPQAVYTNNKVAAQNKADERSKQDHVLNPKNFPALTFACAIFFILYEDTVTFFMFRVLALAEVTVFLNLGPILTVFAGALCLKNEVVGLEHIVKVVISFIGVLLIVLGK